MSTELPHLIFPFADERPSIAELQRIERAMTRAPWNTPAGTRFLGAVSATVAGCERQVASAAGQAPQFDDVPDVGRALSDNACGIASLRNAAPALLEIAAAATLAHGRCDHPDGRCSNGSHFRGCPRFEGELRLHEALAKVRP